MRHAHPKPPFAFAPRATATGAIEWEELPSLAARLVARANDSRFAGESQFERSSTYNAPWDNTQPASFEATPQPQPFRETLSGLATREVNEPEIFRHFFGANARS